MICGELDSVYVFRQFALHSEYKLISRLTKIINRDLKVQSTEHQNIHFKLFNALIPMALALISNCKCVV
jgi:hypothetical protein